MEQAPHVDPGGEGSAGGKTRSHPWLARIVGVAALGAVVVAALHLADLGRLVALLRGAQPAWLLLALALQLLTYTTEVGVWRSVLSRAGHPRPVVELYALAVVSLFTNQALPTAGVAGTVVIVQALKRRGVPMSAALSAMLVDLVGYYAGFGVAVGLSLTVFAVHHELSAIVVGMAAAISLTAIAICGGILWLSAPGHRGPAILARVGPLRRAVATLAVADPALLRSPTLLLLAGLLRFGNFVLDAVTLWACFRAVGEAPPVTYVGAAYVLGTIARTLGVVPGGLGTFEGGTLAGLALLGIAVEPSLAGVLLFRLLSFWLPMVPGLVLSRRFSKSRG